jgi:hypothetical protein
MHARPSPRRLIQSTIALGLVLSALWVVLRTTPLLGVLFRWGLESTTGTTCVIKDLHWDGWGSLSMRELSVQAPGWPGKTAEIMHVDGIRSQFKPWHLLIGRVSLENLDIDSASFRIAQRAGPDGEPVYNLSALTPSSGGFSLKPAFRPEQIHIGTLRFENFLVRGNQVQLRGDRAFTGSLLTVAGGKPGDLAFSLNEVEAADLQTQGSAREVADGVRLDGQWNDITFDYEVHANRIDFTDSVRPLLPLALRQTCDKLGVKGTVSDIGGPTANMYQMRCTRPEVESVCRRQSCVHPKICKLLGVDHQPVIELMREARELPGIKKVLVASGIRMDLARSSPEYIRELTEHHVGGHLKVAPEHVDPDVLFKMRKPSNDDFEFFTERFKEASAQAGKKQFLIPYFIASHPGSSIESMIELALFLKRNGYKPDQVQDFIPAPLDIATSMYYTGLDPFSLKEVFIARALKDRKSQRALMQFFKPENYFEVRDALREVGRSDLIGDGCDCLIPSKAPKEAIEKRRSDANARFRGEYVHTIPNPSNSKAPEPTQQRPEQGATPEANPGANPQRKGSKKQQRPGPGQRSQNGNGKAPGVGYRPGRRVP